MKRFWAIFIKEFRQIRRDPLSLGLLIFIPALLLALYGYALSFDVRHIRMAVLDEDQTAESRQFLDSLFRNPYFDRRLTLDRRAQCEAVLNRGAVRAILIIPNTFARQIQRDECAVIQLLVDGADANSANTVIGYMDALTDRITRQLRIEVLRQAAAAASLPVVLPEVRVWFNPELISARFLVPGLIGLLLMLSAVVATSLSIVREKERQTMDQIMASPIHPLEFIFGKILPYNLICLITVAMILGLGYALFGVVVRGSFLLLGLTVLLFLFAALGMGVLVSSVTRSQQMAFEIAIIVTLLPSVILSGFIFPLASMPAVVRGLTVIVVPRYFVHALRAIILRDAPFGALGHDLLAMFLLGLIFNLLAIHTTRKTL
jgi:ABC-2 type transport system permease protein